MSAVGGLEYLGVVAPSPAVHLQSLLLLALVPIGVSEKQVGRWIVWLDLEQFLRFLDRLVVLPRDYGVSGDRPVH